MTPDDLHFLEFVGGEQPHVMNRLDPGFTSNGTLVVDTSPDFRVVILY